MPANLDVPANLELSTGSWHLNNALIGSAAADLKIGSRSVRMKTGSISMNVDTIDPDWRKYLVTVNEIEKATGYDLLSALPERL